uniref:Ku domain-containing protein n=1 Tax=Timema monikensis TaxID=170555 RepID=A0A7R9E6I2_9NEOP|nr:unnamed protein product [Timema monikensis]
MVAIARRVYNTGSAPIIGALFPKVMYKTKGLMFIRLPFSENLRDFLFRSLKSDLEVITDDQIKSIDTLIDGMDLMEAGDNCDKKYGASCPEKKFYKIDKEKTEKDNTLQR